MPYVVVKLGDLERGRASARGRNGWFKPAEVEVGTFNSAVQDEFYMEVRSRRGGNEPPVWLRVPFKEARQIAEGILGLVGKEVAPISR